MDGSEYEAWVEQHEQEKAGFHVQPAANGGEKTLAGGNGKDSDEDEEKEGDKEFQDEYDWKRTKRMGRFDSEAYTRFLKQTRPVVLIPPWLRKPGEVPVVKDSDDDDDDADGGGGGGGGGSNGEALANGGDGTSTVEHGGTNADAGGSAWGDAADHGDNDDDDDDDGT